MIGEAAERDGNRGRQRVEAEQQRPDAKARRKALRNQQRDRDPRRGERARDAETGLCGRRVVQKGEKDHAREVDRKERDGAGERQALAAAFVRLGRRSASRRPALRNSVSQFAGPLS